MSTALSEKKEKLLYGGFCFGIAVLFLAICSKSSFLYPINDWEDANIFFTAGKSIVHGKVMYRDVYDHKGPLLYFIHSLAYLMSKDTFIGVYWIEVAAFTAYLLAVCKTLGLFVKKNIGMVLPILAAVILSSQSFCHGDSAEELCLPLVAWSMYASLNHFKNRYPQNMPYRELFCHGLLAGCIMLIKFTLLGFHFGWMLMILISCIAKKDWKRGIVSGLVFVGGMLLTTIPFFIYFGRNQALDAWYTGYIYNNIFLYSNADTISLAGQLKAMVKMLGEAFLYNWKFTILIVSGVLCWTFDKKVQAIEKWNIWLIAGCTALGISWGIVYMHPYYPLILAVFACLGFIPILRWLEKKDVRIKMHALLGICGLAAVFAYATGNYTHEIGKSKDEVVQYQFKEIIEETEDPTLINYGFMDGGFYTVCDIVPECKYYSKTNLPGNEWIDLQLTFIGHGWVDYIVTQNHPLSEEYTIYDLVATGTNFYEGKENTYYLYRNISGVKKIPWQD